MVSKKLLLMTLVMLSCTANSSFGMDPEFLVQVRHYAEKTVTGGVVVHKNNPDLKKLVHCCAREAVADQAEGTRGKRGYRKLLGKEIDRVLQNKVDFAKRRDAVKTVLKMFDATCKKIEAHNFARGQKSREIVCDVENALLDAPLNINMLKDSAKVHAQLIHHDPADLTASLMRAVGGAINKQSQRVPVAFRPQFVKRTKQEYAKEVKKAVKRLEV